MMLYFNPLFRNNVSDVGKEVMNVVTILTLDFVTDKGREFIV